MKLSKNEIKKLFINYHFTDFASLENKLGIKAIFEKLRCIQFDPLNVTGRNSDLAIFSRLKDYKLSDINELLYEDKFLIDSWDKVMSIIIRTDFDKFSFNRKIYLSKTNAEIHEEAMKFYENLTSSTFMSKDIQSDKFEWWWGKTKVSRMLIDHLFRIGLLEVVNKNGNQRIYQKKSKFTEVTIIKSDYQKWHILRRIDSMGVCFRKSNSFLIGITQTGKKDLYKILDELVEENLLIEAELEENPNIKFYFKPSFLNGLNLDSRLRFIAPLDNFIWDRDLIETIYDFKYTWEVYKPKAKREFGYYVLPILYKDKLIGRIEPVYNRKTNKLAINNIWFESSKYNTKKIHDLIEKEAKRLEKLLSKTIN